MTIDYGIAILFGVFSFSLKNIGYALQKRGVNEIKATGGQGPGAHFSNGHWLAGQVLPFIGAALLVVSYLFGPISVIMPFSSLSFIVLVLFCRFYLKEEISKAELSAFIPAIAGLALMTAAVGRGEDSHAGFGVVFDATFNPGALVLMAAPLLLLSLPALYTVKVASRFSGPVLGALAGVIGGLSLIFQKPMSLGIAALVKSELSPGEAFPLFLCAACFALFVVLAIVFLNSAYHRDRGVIVTPLYVILQIIVPIAGGIAIYGEWRGLSWTAMGLGAAGCALSLASVCLLVYFGERKRVR
jgi:hypothetical protein